MSSVRGEFGTVSGTVDYGPANVGATRLSAEVGVTSVDTRDAKRDDHLRSPDFFDAAKFPTIKCVSKAVKNIAPTGFDVVGDLTLHGVTKEVVLHDLQRVQGPVGEHQGRHPRPRFAQPQGLRIVYNAALYGGGFILGGDVKIELDAAMVRKVPTGRRHPDRWSGRRESNPRQRAWEARALPTELRPRCTCT